MRIEIVDLIGSTSEELKRRAAEGGGEAALLARRQDAGHGRLGRPWVSAAGNLHLSVLLRPGAAIMPGHWSLMAAVAVADTVRLHAPGVLGLRLKWPNDVLLGEGKLAGILLEAGADATPWLVIGFGVNLVAAPADVGRPTACLADFGKAPEACAVAADLVRGLGAWRGRYECEGFAPVRAAWLAMGPALGAAIVVSGREGRFGGIGADGALLVEREGALEAVVSGEVE